MASGPNRFHERSPRPRCNKGLKDPAWSHSEIQWVLLRTLPFLKSSFTSLELAEMSLTVRRIPSLGRWWLQARDHPQPPASEIPLTRKTPNSTTQKHRKSSTFDSWDLPEFPVKEFPFHEHHIRSHQELWHILPSWYGPGWHGSEDHRRTPWP